MAIDLVCGMEVDERTAKFFSEYKGRKFFFCGRMCKEEFDDDPEKFLRLESKVRDDNKSSRTTPHPSDES